MTLPLMGDGYRSGWAMVLRRAVRDQYRLEQLVGVSEPMQQVLEFVQKVADSDSTVMIQGESGTGKELVARMLHFNSLRRDRPLVPVNCGAIPRELLESDDVRKAYLGY